MISETLDVFPKQRDLLVGSKTSKFLDSLSQKEEYHRDLVVRWQNKIFPWKKTIGIDAVEKESRRKKNISLRNFSDIFRKTCQQFQESFQNKTQSDFSPLLEKKTHWFPGKQVFFRKSKLSKKSSFLKLFKKENLISLGKYMALCAVLYLFLSPFFIVLQVHSIQKNMQILSDTSGNFSDYQDLFHSLRWDFFWGKVLIFPFRVLPSEKIDFLYAVFSSGNDISYAFEKWWFLLHSQIDFIQKKGFHDIYFSQFLINGFHIFQQADARFNAWYTTFKNISGIPSKFEQSFIQAWNSLDKVENFSQKYVQNFPEIMNLLGHEEKRRYMIVFQNADEIRPLGGFMGSMALVEIYKWKVKLFQTKDIYDIEWDLKSASYERLPAPKWISELTEKFWLRDANYDPELSASSEKIDFFLSHAGIKIDGIVYVNQHILEDILKILGPIDFPEIWMQVSADNFSSLMSLLVEQKVVWDATLESPKKILFDFMHHFYDSFQSSHKIPEIAELIFQQRNSHEILFWSKHSKENMFLSEIGLSTPQFQNIQLDELYPVFTSLSGNKSDRYIARSISQKVTPDSGSCDYNITTTLSLSHSMPEKEKKYLQDVMKKFGITDTVSALSIQWNQKNRQYVRVLLPSNALAQESGDYTVTNLSNRQQIEFFLDTLPNQSQDFSFSYKLLNPSCEPYSFSLLKQPGINYSNIKIQFPNKEVSFQNIKEDFIFSQ